MTQKIEGRPLLSPGRKPLIPPDSCQSTVAALAADGFSVKGVACKLGVSADTLRKWFVEYPTIQAAFDEGRERERHSLHNALFRAAIEKGNVVAAIFLLKARHSYIERDRELSSQAPNGKVDLSELAKLLPN